MSDKPFTKKQFRKIEKKRAEVQRIIGRKLVGVSLNPFDVNDERESRPDDPGFNAVFEFEGGYVCSFFVQETEIGEYGVEPLVRKVKKRPSYVELGTKMHEQIEKQLSLRKEKS